MDFILWIVVYMMSVPLSWFMFRLAITSDDRPETHPLKFLAISTFIPVFNILLSFYGLIVFWAFSKIKFGNFFRL